MLAIPSRPFVLALNFSVGDVRLAQAIGRTHGPELAFQGGVLAGRESGTDADQRFAGSDLESLGFTAMVSSGWPWALQRSMNVATGVAKDLSRCERSGEGQGFAAVELEHQIARLAFAGDLQDELQRLSRMRMVEGKLRGVIMPGCSRRLWTPLTECTG
jgi:hypothetical protein